MSTKCGSAETVLDDLLATLQHCGLSALELRVLIRLADRPTAQSELADVLQARSGAMRRAIRRLAMRGLIGRRFERGPRSRFVLSISSSGRLTVAPLVECIAEAHRPQDEWPLGINGRQPAA